MKNYYSRLTAEFLGTFALVFVGAGAVIVESHTGLSHLGIPDGKVRLWGIALAHGLTLTAMIYAFGSISGAHINPAVSFAVWLRQKLSSDMLVGYVVAQLTGAIVAGALLAAIFPDEITFAALGTPSLSPRINGVKGVAIEAIITFLLVLSILFATRNENENRAFAGLAIGGTLVALILFAGPLTGAGANPARYIGPAVFTGNLSQALIYIAGPMVGAGLASLAFGVVCDLYQSESDPISRSGASADEDAPTTAEADDLYDGPAAFVSPEMLTLHEAHELLRAGRGHEAARKIVPLLSRIGEQSPDVLDHLRTLAIVIEDELGPLELFDRYRARIWSQAPRFAHTRSGILRERLP